MTLSFGLHVSKLCFIVGSVRANYSVSSVVCKDGGSYVCFAFSSQRPVQGRRQSEEHWNRFIGNVGETSERRGGAHMDFSNCIDTTLN